MHLKKLFALLFAFTLVCCSVGANHAASSAVSGRRPGPGAQCQRRCARIGNSAPDDKLPVQTFRTRSDEVNIIFTVTDKHNKFIKDLKENQFKFLDNNKPPKQIMNFSAEADLSLRVGLLIDASNSIRDRFLFEQDAAIEFLHQIIRPEDR